MAAGLVPIPNQPISETHEWREWFFNLWESLGGAQGQIFYTGLNFTGSNLNSIQTRAHNILQGLQGGNVGGTEYYHLDSTQYATLTALSLPLSIANGGTAATTQAGARTNLGLGSGLSVTITTAKLTGAGANGSMTFVNGILTAQTQAT
jgi:hypothetical protein